MDNPYRYLNINIEIDNWQQCVPSLDKVHIFVDKKAKLLSAETVDAFKDLGILPIYGILWSRNHGVNGSFHTDGNKTDPWQPFVAVNVLLSGSPSITEWTSIDKLTLVEDVNIDKHFGTFDTRYTGDEIDFSASVHSDMPMLIRVDVPHRVRLDTIDDTRWTYSIRFLNIETKASLTWEDALVKFHSVISE